MTRFTTILLTIAITGLAVGTFVASQGQLATPALALVLPIGAVAFGLFLIALALQKEVAVYDREQALKKKSSGYNTGQPKPIRNPLPARTEPAVHHALSNTRLPGSSRAIP